MTSAHPLRHDRHHPGQVRAPRHPGRRWILPPLAQPEELELFSDRIDHAREYESTVRDFVVLRDRELSDEVYSS